jgi:YHS domain-containing protein
MNFLARILRFVFWVVIFSWILKLTARLLGRAMQTAGDRARPDAPGGAAGTGAAEIDGKVASENASDSAGRPQLAARQLVRDPVCGMHLAETLAIPFRDRGELLHFCSAECRDKYAHESLRRVANG